ncbi:MAG: hypothetical protein BGO89_06720 [Candidatus Kapaibacterium thiocyanatum]|uniref:Fido domain-containing protein n=1 Tax=Candidatus Kapaibacterium thiocyanatum TaxID=1895771 RepID=A0A1M3KZD6_9BACT|nr:MAG: hypothetical protein BGO89_06720 ['Candidatus Kapabacteria' thiocyanatum]
MTQEDVDRMYDQQISLPVSKEYLGVEVRNILDAMNTIIDDILAGKELPVTPNLICTFHQLVSKNLGDHIDCIPGRFRQDNRYVGSYRAPDYSKVANLVERLCDWMRLEFHYPEYKNDWYDAIVQAIVAHVYLEWIHPFGDGNGRTGRLLEFYILVRAGMPVITCTLLSNFYNDTRSEYYRQFDVARRNNDLSSFIKYAVRGLCDKIKETLAVAQVCVTTITWSHYIYEQFDKKTTSEATKRRRKLALSLKIGVPYTREEIVMLNPEMAREYLQTQRLAARDINALVNMGILRAYSGLSTWDDDIYITNHTKLLLDRMPDSKHGPDLFPNS